MRLSKVRRFYSREDIREEMYKLADNREVVGRLQNGSFQKRPNTLLMPHDIYEMAKDGVVSFHVSEEIWKNPQSLSQDLSRKKMDELRGGWDLLLDIDSKSFKYTTMCTSLLKEALEFHNLEGYSLKFSGGTGWHIAVPWKSIPKKLEDKKTKKMFPFLPKVVSSYLKEFIKDHLEDQILEEAGGSLKKIANRINKSPKDLLIKTEGGKKFDPYNVLEIDTVFIASRHLYRMPYSFHEGTGLVSLPIQKEEFENFKGDWAKPENVEIRAEFLANGSKDEASELIREAYDWYVRKKNIEEEEEKETEKSFQIPEKAIGKRYFPPCIKNILKGIEDGRKRAVFILINFLKKVGWSYSKIEKLLVEWNNKNDEPLRENYIKTQLRWHKDVNSVYTPPNCDNEGYYKDMRVCEPDKICKNIKNPVTYPFRKMEKNGKE